MTEKHPEVVERTAVELLNKSVTEFLERGGEKHSRDEVAQTRRQLLTWLFTMFEAKNLGRHDLEQIFHRAETATTSAPALQAISDIWDSLDAELPAPQDDEYTGSQAEVTGDYSRLYYPKPERAN